MLFRSEGIVIKTFEFAEADLIVTYLTKDFGLIKTFAKSSRKTKSRFGSSLEPITYSKISFMGKEYSNLPRLTQSDIIYPFYKLREELKCFVKNSELLELNLNFLQERENNIEMFNLFLDILKKIEINPNNNFYYLYYKIKFLEKTGFLPKLDVCGRCGSITHKQSSNNFYLYHGSIICNKCISDDKEAIKISTSSLKFFNSVADWSIETIERIKAPEIFISEISIVMNYHIKYILLKPSKSINFLNNYCYSGGNK